MGGGGQNNFAPPLQAQMQPQVGRQRGRPRKIIDAAPPPQVIAGPQAAAARAPRAPIPRSQVQLENILPAAQNLGDGQRLTRAQAHLVERQNLPTDVAVNLIKIINNWFKCNAILQNVENVQKVTLKQKLKQRLLKLKSVVKNRHKNISVIDEFGLEKNDKSEAVIRRRKFLQKLSPKERNLVLTGDPGFIFDPIVYEQILFAPGAPVAPGVPAPPAAAAPPPPPPALPPVIQQNFDYLLPEPQEEFVPPEPNPEPEVHSDSDPGDFHSLPASEQELPSSSSSDAEVVINPYLHQLPTRSEERRVGKECR